MTVADPTLVPAPPPEAPRLAPGEGVPVWLRRNLFRTPVDAVVTVVSLVVVGYVLFRLGRFVFVTGRWKIVRVNLNLFMVGRYPRAELWRVVACVLGLALLIGTAVGSGLQRQRRESGPSESRTIGQRVRDAIRRVWPLALGIGLLLSMTTTALPALFVAAIIGAFAIGRLVADQVPDRFIVWFVFTATVVVGLLVWYPNGAAKVVVVIAALAAATLGAVLLPGPPPAAVLAIGAAAMIRVLVSSWAHDLIGEIPSTVLAVAVGGGAAVAMFRIRDLPGSVLLWIALGAIPLSISAIRLLTRAVGWDGWGGMMLNLFLAVAGISLCFPLGVLLALGRRAGRAAGSITGGIIAACILGGPPLLLAILHGVDFDNTTSKVLLVLTVVLAALGFVAGLRSSLPVLRVVSVAYIELIRGAPLYVLLLVSASALGFFLPEGFTRPTQVVRAIVVFTLFTAAYIAEIVRGGLQSLPRGQVEAGQALGLSPGRITGLIVLPQALRNVIPAVVGQFISLFKDTTLAGAAMGFADMFSVRESALAQQQFDGQRLIPETIAFVMLVFWVGCITLSRESQRLERRLGVGTR
jgi:general L-amino acid transport system permease protein